MKTRWLERARVVLALLALATGAQGATFTVTNAANSGAGSLRQAILDANATAGADTIGFALAGCPCTITLASGLTITDEVIIAGPGMDQLAVSGGNAIQPFLIGAVPATLTDFTVRNGLSDFAAGGVRSYGPLTLARMKFLSNQAAVSGGAVMFAGPLSIVDSVFEQNRAILGGALRSEGGSLTMIRSTLSANQASGGAGGAIYTLSPIVISDSLFEHNSANSGGAIAGSDAASAITDSAFDTNTATGNGGAINGGNFTLQNCTFTGNTAGIGGGALLGSDGTVISNSSFTGNSATGTGGAVWALGTANVTGSTFTGNTSAGAGGAIAVAGQATISVSRFTGNAAGAGSSGGGAITFDYNATELTLTDSVFEANTAPVGGAILGGSSTGTLRVLGSEFSGNSATQKGGAIATTFGFLDVYRSRFLANTAVTGGALFVDIGRIAVVANSLLAGNATPSGNGRAIHLEGAGTVSLVHLTIANAGTRFAGSAIQGWANPSPDIVNSLIADHEVALRLTAGAAAPSRVLVWNTGFPPPAFLVQGGATIDTSLVAAGDPKFVDAAHGDYHLGLGSAAVDFSPSFRLASDIDGDSRPQGAAYDAGFDERVPGTQAITFPAIADRLLGQPPFTVSATASSTLAVTFSSLTTGVCTVSGTTAALVAVGTCTLAADQAGDKYWAAAPRVSRSFAVTLPLHTLTVAKAGAGTGTVTSSPAGIACGATCTAPYNQGTVVTLTATPAPPSVFTGWSGGGCSGTGTCQVTMNAAQSVTATFAIGTVALTVTKAGAGTGTVSSIPAGIACGATCTAPYNQGTAVTLTATPATPSVFTGWSGGGCSGTGTCQVTMNAAQSVTATFAIGTVALTVTKSGSGSGAVTSNPAGVDCGATCNASFASGASVALTATAQAGSVFAAWSGACTGTGACRVTMDAAKSVNAEFKPASTIPRLANISTRMQVLTGDNVLIGGFIIGGTQAKTVVVRARGPSLTAAGVPGALANPVMQLFAGAVPIAANDNWQEAANAATIQASGFAPSDPFESAILTSLTPGAYTAIVTGYGLTTGVAIVEIFEVDLPQVPLVNIATRGLVLTGADVMIGGFIIQGDAPQTVIVRARGPSLAGAGVPGVLANPLLQLFAGSTQVAVNDNWGDGPDAAAIQSAGFAPAHALESAIRITLTPGAYTAIVTGAGGVTGVGIIEVFAQ